MIVFQQKPRFRFREKAPEWITSIGILWWGVIALIIPGLFSQDFFYPLSLFMAQPFWGSFATITGLAGIGVLLVNGVWRPSAHLRAIVSIFKVGIWCTLLLASLTTEGRQLGVPTFGMLMALDILALWWASEDARVADDTATKSKEVANGD